MTGSSLGCACLTERHSAKGADQAEKGPAALARITFRRPLLPTAGSADHDIALVDLRHDALGGEIVPLDLVDQRRPRDAELDRGAGTITGVVF